MTPDEKELCARAREALAGEERGVVAFTAPGQVAIVLVNGRHAAAVADLPLADVLDAISGILGAACKSCVLAGGEPPAALLEAFEALRPFVNRCACVKCTASRQAQN